MHSDIRSTLSSRLARTAAALVVALVALGAAGCTPRYANAPALAYDAIPYESVDGKPWKLTRVSVEGVRQKYGLRTETHVAYVELNPQGKRTVVFLHGLGSYLKFWRYQLDAFAAEGYRVIAIDMLGYGKSDKPASFPYTMEAMADVVREVLQIIGLPDNPVLVGHSMGGQVAASFALRFPDEVDALVLTSPAGFEEFSARERAWFKKVITTAGIKGAREYDIWGSIAYGNFGSFRSEFNWLIEERVRTAKNDTFDSYAYANLKSILGLSKNDFVRQNLEKIATPTLIVYGTRDRLIPNPFLHGGTTASIMEPASERIRGSKLVPLSGCGHTVQMDCWEEYNPAVLSFVGGLDAPRARKIAEQPKEEAPPTTDPPSKDPPPKIDPVPGTDPSVEPPAAPATPPSDPSKSSGSLEERK